MNTERRQDLGLSDFLPFLFYLVIVCNAPHKVKMHPTLKMGCIKSKKNKNGHCIQITVLIWSE